MVVIMCHLCLNHIITMREVCCACYTEDGDLVNEMGCFCFCLPGLDFEEMLFISECIENVCTWLMD